MGEVINRTSDIAREWQRHIVWIRINVGYIRAELPYLKESGGSVSDIQTLVDSFDSTFEQFCRNELQVFVAARRLEIDDREKSAMIIQLRRMRESFFSWLREYNVVVEARKASDPKGLLLSLLLCCAGELLKAHSCFVDIIEAYVEEIESHHARCRPSHQSTNQQMSRLESRELMS